MPFILSPGDGYSVEHPVVTSVDRHGKPLLLRFQLVKPINFEKSKSPAIVLVHGSGGTNDFREGRHARFFVKHGMCVAIVDSFTPRNVAQTITDQDAVTSDLMVTDAFKVLKYLGSDSCIDAARIGIAGFSKGGSVALFTAFDQFASQRSADGLRFALHVPIYPGCGVRYFNIRTTGKPIYFQVGGEDKWVNPRHAEEYINTLTASGAKVTASFYPKAAHAWDGQSIGRNFNKDGQLHFNCRFVQEEDGSWHEESTGTSCMGDGAWAKAASKCMTLGTETKSNHVIRDFADHDFRSFVLSEFGVTPVVPMPVAYPYDINAIWREDTLDDALAPLDASYDGTWAGTIKWKDGPREIKPFEIKNGQGRWQDTFTGIGLRGFNVSIFKRKRVYIEGTVWKNAGFTGYEEMKDDDRFFDISLCGATRAWGIEAFGYWGNMLCRVELRRTRPGDGAAA